MILFFKNISFCDEISEIVSINCRRKVIVPPCACAVFSAASSPSRPTNAQHAATLSSEFSIERKAPKSTEDIHPLPVILAISGSPFLQYHRRSPSVRMSVSPDAHRNSLFCLANSCIACVSICCCMASTPTTVLSFLISAPDESC